MASHTHEAPESKHPTRPRWLFPALATGAVAIALVVAGILPLGTALYAGAFGGMMLMHLGGHGGHSGGGAGHTAHRAADGNGDADAPAVATPDDAPRRGGCH